MITKKQVEVNSEIGVLQGVILHTPGPEIENMTPDNAQRALYSDILNLNVALQEYQEFGLVLKKIVSNVFTVSELISELIQEDSIRLDLLEEVIRIDGVQEIREELLRLPSEKLTKILIQGLPLSKNTLTNFLSKERFSLQPLHNFFFTRDASVAIWDIALISRMANIVRARESRVMNTIFTHKFNNKVIDPQKGIVYKKEFTYEGGDILIASDNVILIGIGKRTNAQGVDYIIEQLSKRGKDNFTVIVQELPDSPESFIHLDMVFTFLDQDKCMVYEPLILKRNRYQTIKISVSHGEAINIEYEENILKALESCGIFVKPLYCGGKGDTWIQEREQWHSGANFLAIAPGKVIGYGRNVHTVEELNKNGFEIIQAHDIIEDKVNIEDYSKCMIALDGSELARGGGGARCMSMPFLRKNF